MFKRFYLFERVDGINLHGIGTVLGMDNASIGDMTIISCNELQPGLGIAYFLRDENDYAFEVERVTLLEAGGVNPPALVAPFVMEIVKK